MITGVASGFGEIAAFDLAKKGHKVIATAQVYPQMSDLIRDTKELHSVISFSEMTICKDYHWVFH